MTAFSHLFPFPLIQIPPQCCPADAEFSGGRGAVAAVGGHGFPDNFQNALVECFRRGRLLGLLYHRVRRAEQALALQEVQDSAAPDIGAVGECGERAEQVLELGVVIRPGIAAEQLQRARLEGGNLFAEFQVQVVQVETRKRGNLIGAISERGES